jgi:hypothetical protein
MIQEIELGELVDGICGEHGPRKADFKSRVRFLVSASFFGQVFEQFAALYQMTFPE